MKLSVVSTLYNSASHIGEFYRRISASASAIFDDYEIIMVNDGSPDDSLKVVKEFVENDPHVVLVDLSRNFGHHKAIMAGLSYAQGDYVFLIDCDLEEDPENLPRFYEELIADEECDVVYGVQPIRKGSAANKVFARIFYRILNALSDIHFDENMVFSRIMTKRYVSNLIKFREKEMFIVGLWAMAGFVQKSIMITTKHRGETSYTFRKKLEMVVDAITSFSNKPLSMIFYTGLVIEVVAILYLLEVLFSYLYFKEVLSGWGSIIISIWLLGGAIILFLGVIGQYLSKIFLETKDRPYVIVRDEIRNQYNANDTKNKGNDL